MSDNLNLLRSSVPYLAWPMLPDNAGTLALGAQFQLEQTERWSPAELLAQQLRQLQLLLQHAHDALPYWRARLVESGYRPGIMPTQEWLTALPLLTRKDVQAQGDALLCRNLPPQHGQITQGQTSGSTGRPITCYGTDVTQFFWRAFTLRDHLWQKRDLSGKLAAIRSSIEDARAVGWGPATDLAFATGPTVMRNITTDLNEQMAWLRAEDPDYLITFPSNLRALADRAIAGGMCLPRLREVRTFGETLADDLRGLCQRAWGVPLTDLYSAQEVGYIALQCPGREHYHVQAENLIVEILDAHGQACAPGQIGRVVVSTLHNFAMPLIRYEIGDYAEVGPPCECGRQLPVLRSILGRARNILTLPDGRQHWASFPADQWAHIAPVTQLQMVQKSKHQILLRVVASRELTEDEQRNLIGAMQNCLGHPFHMQIERVAGLSRSSNGKFEDFISEIMG